MSDWYYVAGGKQSGPVSSKRLKELANGRQLAPTDLIWKAELSNWIKASQLKGLFPVRHNGPPPLPNPESSTGSVPAPPPVPRTVVAVAPRLPVGPSAQPTAGHRSGRGVCFLLGLAFGVCLGIGLVVGYQTVAKSMFSSTASLRARITKANFDRIELGMSRSEVEAILGPCTQEFNPEEYAKATPSLKAKVNMPGLGGGLGGLQGEFGTDELKALAKQSGLWLVWLAGDKSVNVIFDKQSQKVIQKLQKGLD